MDHFALTLIIGSIEIVVLPWAVWATVRVFELQAKIAVLQNQMENEIKIQKLQNSNITNSIHDLKKEVDDIKLELNNGFKEVMNAINNQRP